MLKARLLGAVGIVAVGTVTLSLAVRAQEPEVVAKPVTLEVASIKENLENRGGALGMRPGGLFVATNIRVRDFINMAFRTDPALLSQQIIDLPPRASMVRFDIQAKYVYSLAATCVRSMGPVFASVVFAVMSYRRDVSQPGPPEI
jgi:hypothetical protein